MYDRWRRERVKAYHHLYTPLKTENDETCFYCHKAKANTIDHCPSLIDVALMGVEFFVERKISLLLIPACMECNNGVGGGCFKKGRRIEIDLRRIRREIRKKELKKSRST